MPDLVNVDNYVRAETDRAFDVVLKDSGGINRWSHNRVPTPLDHQGVVRQNRDTLYSVAIVDVSEGATLTVPEHGSRYVSAMVVSRDHYIPRIIHDAGTYELSAEQAGSDTAMIAVRILVDPADPDDVAAVNALQDGFVVNAASARPFAHPDYDAASFDSTQKQLIALSRGLPDFRGAFGAKGEVDDVRHLLASASAWGGLPESEAIYLNVEPGLPVGHYELTVSDVPVDAFWSITVYNADGYMEVDPRGVVSVNSVTAAPNPDGSITVRFGDGDEPNSIPTPDGWNYLVRLYRPRAAARNREWTFSTVSRPTTPTVLFVCVHNAGRSQMAAGFLRELGGGRVEVLSGGSEPGDRINPIAVQAMAEAGIDIANEQPKVLTADAVRESDVVITMGCGDTCPVFPGKRYEDWELTDPAGRPLDEVRPIRDEIKRRVEGLLAEISPA